MEMGFSFYIWINVEYFVKSFVKRYLVFVFDNYENELGF